MSRLHAVDLSIQSFPLKLNKHQRCAECKARLQAGRNAWMIRALGVPTFYCGVPHLRRGLTYWKRQRERVIRNEGIALTDQLTLGLEAQDDQRRE
jgi:hypothetical protein